MRQYRHRVQGAWQKLSYSHAGIKISDLRFTSFSVLSSLSDSMVKSDRNYN